MPPQSPSIHASCVTVNGTGVLIRGESGAGKSRLAHILLMRGPALGLDVRLVADDRVLLRVEGDGLFARAPEAIAGLLEVRGFGLVRFPSLAEARLGLVLDLLPQSAIPRLPDEDWARTSIEGVTLPRVAACSPENSLDILLTVTGQSGGSLHLPVSLASVRIDGKTEHP